MPRAWAATSSLISSKTVKGLVKAFVSVPTRAESIDPHIIEGEFPGGHHLAAHLFAHVGRCKARGPPFSTMKTDCPSREGNCIGVRLAQNDEKSQIVPLVIKVLEPLMTNSLACLIAVVLKEVMSLPWSGSVKAPDRWPRLA